MISFRIPAKTIVLPACRFNCFSISSTPLSETKATLAVPLLAPVAAYALFADRLLGKSIYAIPYRGAGVLEQGKELLSITDSIRVDPGHDRGLVDAWASAIGMNGWYAWIPYKP